MNKTRTIKPLAEQEAFMLRLLRQGDVDMAALFRLNREAKKANVADACMMRAMASLRQRGMARLTPDCRRWVLVEEGQQP